MGDSNQSSEQTSVFSPNIHSNGTSSPRIDSQLTGKEGNTKEKKRGFRETVKIFILAYIASLSILGMVIPVIASIIIVGLYLILPNSTEVEPLLWSP